MAFVRIEDGCGCWELFGVIEVFWIYVHYLVGGLGSGWDEGVVMEKVYRDLCSEGRYRVYRRLC